MKLETLKQGTSFQRIAVIPLNYPDGFFLNWIPKGQLRTKRDPRILCQELTCSWLSPQTTRYVSLSAPSSQTRLWPFANLVLDLRFIAPDGGVIDIVDYLEYKIIRPVTQI
jgi:hypothetical protein